MSDVSEPLLRMLRELGFADDRVKLVINKYRAASDIISPDVVADQLAREVDEVVPFVAPVAAASHRGAPALFERGATPFRDAVVRLAREMTRKERRSER